MSNSGRAPEEQCLFFLRKNFHTGRPGESAYWGKFEDCLHTFQRIYFHKGKLEIETHGFLIRKIWKYSYKKGRKVRFSVSKISLGMK